MSHTSDWTCTRRRFAWRWRRAAAVERYGRSGCSRTTPRSWSRMVARLGKSGRRLSFCYEAGPCGYGLHRLLTGCGHSCVVVAPSPIPMKTGDRVKTDRRDAMMLAKLRRAGELTQIWIPDAAHEEMRDLVRACENAPNRGSQLICGTPPRAKCSVATDDAMGTMRSYVRPFGAVIDRWPR